MQIAVGSSGMVRSHVDEESNNDIGSGSGGGDVVIQIDKPRTQAGPLPSKGGEIGYDEATVGQILTSGLTHSNTTGPRVTHLSSPVIDLPQSCRDSARPPAQIHEDRRGKHRSSSFLTIAFLPPRPARGRDAAERGIKRPPEAGGATPAASNASSDS